MKQEWCTKLYFTTDTILIRNKSRWVWFTKCFNIFIFSYKFTTSSSKNVLFCLLYFFRTHKLYPDLDTEQQLYIPSFLVQITRKTFDVSWQDTTNVQTDEFSNNIIFFISVHNYYWCDKMIPWYLDRR
jgi:hypothetical protein